MRTIGGAAIYLRISTVDQRTGNQGAELRQVAERRSPRSHPAQGTGTKISVQFGTMAVSLRIPAANSPPCRSGVTANQAKGVATRTAIRKKAKARLLATVRLSSGLIVLSTGLRQTTSAAGGVGRGMRSNSFR